MRMDMLEPLAMLPLTAQERKQLLSYMQPLLTDCLRRHTMGDSSSVRVEVAQQVFAAVCFALKQVPEELHGGDLFAAYRHGQERLRQKAETGRKVWMQVMNTLPKVPSDTLLTTVRSIGSFFDHADPTIPEIPCTIDYPLLIPVSETLLGIDYLNQWLAQLLLENRFMSLFSVCDMQRVLRRHCADYEELPINLCSPILLSATGGWMLHSGQEGLVLSESERQRLAERFEGRTAEAIGMQLRQALAELLSGILGAAEMESYLRRALEEAAVRIANVSKEGIANGVF